MFRTIPIAMLFALVSSVGADAQSGPPSSVAFHSSRDGNNTVYVMDPDGANQSPRTFDAHNNQRAEVSPDGRRIVFASNRIAGGSHLQIFVMNADGTAVQQLPEPPNATTNTWPRWSPDGQWVAFQATAAGASQVYLVRADGSSQPTQITFSGTNQFPAWSPDGTRLAMRRNTDIYVMDLTGRPDPGQLTTVGPLNQMPSWSPDGTQIAFMSTREPLGNYPSVFVMNADGSGQTDLTPRTADGVWSSRAPAWSPDGKYIYFTGLRGQMTDEQIFVMRADGSDQRPLTMPRGANLEATVRRVRPPHITSVSATPDVLWPPNNKSVHVSVSVGVSDDSDPAPACRIASIANNESIVGDGWGITGVLTAELLAQRLGGGTGRVYTITVECVNTSQLRATDTVTVTVPHDQGQPRR